ncbi:Hypothetical predicted protein [Octopus vulgaris]|uniref:Uncharacterized protein n=1 Tax=Octopus vulgaris TaxID=6645 RepID=A0AA36AII5_OCTVU|nr:Hypothetical predicted protein [Octopus vulgaris]
MGKSPLPSSKRWHKIFFSDATHSLLLSSPQPENNYNQSSESLVPTAELPIANNILINEFESSDDLL